MRDVKPLKVEEAVAEEVSSAVSPEDDGDDSAATDDEGTPVAAAPPTRDELRALIRAKLADGSLTEHELLSDIAAAIYHTELMFMSMQQQMDRFMASPLGRMLGRKARKEMERHGVE